MNQSIHYIMLRRSLTIFPAFLLVPLFNINRFIGLFIKGSNQHEIDLNKNEDQKRRCKRGY